MLVVWLVGGSSSISTVQYSSQAAAAATATAGHWWRRRFEVVERNGGAVARAFRLEAWKWRVDSLVLDGDGGVERWIYLTSLSYMCLQKSMVCLNQ